MTSVNMALTYETNAPEDKADSLVVLLHGYGSDGKDLISLSQPWRGVLPHTCFVAPNAPKVCEQFAGGFQWTSLRDWDPARIVGELQELRPQLNAFIDGKLKELDLAPDRLVLVGFSQGVFVSLDVALHRPECAGVLGYSGGLFEDPISMKIAKPPVLLVHGEDDTVVNPETSRVAAEQLKRLGCEVELELLPGLDHGINERGVAMGAAFIKAMLYATEEEHHHHHDHA